MLVELGRAGPLIGRAQGLAIPPDYEVVPIGIVDRIHEKHHVRQDAERFRIIRRGQVVGQLQGEVGCGDLG